MIKWKEISVPALETILSTGQAQPLAPEAWPLWAHTTPEFSGAWFSYVGGPPATSTGTLSTGSVKAYVDIERTASQPPTLRYYRYLYVKMTDGRVFQSSPVKELEYNRHREQRPPWLASYITSSTSTG
jgi:hypothetical protein